MLKKICRKMMGLILLPLKIINKPIIKSSWFKSLFVGDDGETYPNNAWYRKHDERNFDLVNLGSSGGKWAFDYSGFNIKAMNWAQQPQTLLEDFNLLRNFHSILKKGGVVLITIMPFTGLNKSTGVKDAMKYLKIDARDPIQPYEFRKAILYAKFPILMGKPAIKAGIKHLLGKEKTSGKPYAPNLEKNLMNVEQLEADAARWIDGWKVQFGISDFDAPLTAVNQKGREYRIKLMRTLIDFCIERSYKPIYVIPPVTKHLSKYYTKKFKEIYIYDYLAAVNRQVPILDYSEDDVLQDDGLFFNSFFLNKKGRKLFTSRVLKDVSVENENRCVDSSL